MNDRPGENAGELHLHSLQENKEAAISLAEQARHSIVIFTHDMDAAIYDNHEFEQCLFALTKKNPGNRIRILTRDNSRSLQHGHCLARLAQRLTSSVHIHNPAQRHGNESCAFMVVDRSGYLYRATAGNSNYHATVGFMSAQVAVKLLDFFDEAWEHSTPDMQMRRLFI